MEHHGTRVEVALKTVRKDPEIERAIRQEQTILRELAGTRGVLELLGSFHDEKNYYLVTVSARRSSYPSLLTRPPSAFLREGRSFTRDLPLGRLYST